MQNFQYAKVMETLLITHVLVALTEQLATTQSHDKRVYRLALTQSSLITSSAYET
jgi:hypothetical protein